MAERSPARQAVHAYIVTTAGADELAHSDVIAVIDAVAIQTPLPDYVTLVCVGEVPGAASTRLREAFGDRASVVALPEARNFGDALRQAMTAAPTQTGTPWLWLLHDDTKPDSRALAELVIAASQGAAIGVVGPKQVRWGDRDELLELGIEATRTGRRVPLGVAREIDQGQYDDRVDVLAVGSAGVLVRTDVWAELRGFDPELGPFGDGLEFGRRARRAGHRVIVAPKAVIEHRQSSLDPKGASFAKRRAAQMYNWLLAAPPGVPILLLPLLIFWAPVRALGRLAARSPAYAAAELAALASVARSGPAVRRGRRRDRATAVLPRSRLSTLETSPRKLERRRRLARRVGRERARPTDLVDAPTRSRLRAHRKAGWMALGVITLIAMALSFFFWYPLLGGIRGGNWGEFPLTQADLWKQGWSAWVYGGVGSQGPSNALLTLFSLVAAPFALIGVSASELGIAILALAPPLAALSAWLFSGCFTKLPWQRATAALLWALQPALLLSVGTADLSATLLWVAMPLALTGLWKGTRVVRPLHIESIADTLLVERPDVVAWGAVAALSGVVAASGAPAVAPILLVVGIIFVVVPTPGRRAADSVRGTQARSDSVGTGSLISLTQGRGADNRAVGETGEDEVEAHASAGRYIAGLLPWIPAGLLVAPTLAWAVPRLGSSEGWVALLAPNGSSLWPDTPWWAWFPAGLLVLAAVLAMLASVARGFHWVASAAAGLVAGGLLWAVVFVPQAARTLLPLMGLALLTAALLSLPTTRLRAEEAGAGGTRAPIIPAIALAAGVVAFVGILTAGPLSLGGRAALHPTDGHAAPLVAEQAAISDTHGRTLVLTDREDEPTEAALWRQGARSQADLSLGLHYSDLDTHFEAQKTLAAAVGTLAARPSPEAAQLLADMAVEIIVLNAGAPTGVGTLEAHLDATDGLERIGTTDVGTMWRNRSTGRIFATSRSDTFVLPEPAAPGWRAQADGERLESVPDPDPKVGWRQSFAAPGGDAAVRWGYSPAWSPWWKWAVLASLAVAAILAVPWRRRRPEWFVWEEPSKGEGVREFAPKTASGRSDDPSEGKSHSSLEDELQSSPEKSLQNPPGEEPHLVDPGASPQELAPEQEDPEDADASESVEGSETGAEGVARGER